jgi:hypothetical protein
MDKNKEPTAKAVGSSFLRWLPAGTIYKAIIVVSASLFSKLTA